MEIGYRILIVHMDGEPEYTGKIGVITYIDDIGQLHGTWGNLAVNLTVDKIEILDKGEYYYVD